MHPDPHSSKRSYFVLQLLLLLTNVISYCIPNQRLPRRATDISLAMSNRRSLLKQILQVGHLAILFGGYASFPSNVAAFTSSSIPMNSRRVKVHSSALSTSTDIVSSSLANTDLLRTAKQKATVLYHPIEIPINEFGVTIPIACWYPTCAAAVGDGTNNLVDVDVHDGATSSHTVTYQHRISVRRIGQLLAGWNFIPEFVSKSYLLEPTSSVTSNNIHVTHGPSATNTMVTKAPVIFLAHGYLGSRFDLSHLAEELSSMGYICIAAEYPESLAASYERMDGLDRSAINKAILQSLQEDEELWNNIQPTGYGVIGHSLGCGTAIQMGSDDWARVLIAGFPQNRDGTPVAGNNLFITSINDSLARNRINPTLISSCNYKLLSEQDVSNNEQLIAIPRRAAILFDRPDAPNHISYLCEGVNNAMIEFLSPLLPLAQALSIPVLDFDKYKESRDSIATASIVHPLIIRYLQQELKHTS